MLIAIKRRGFVYRNWPFKLAFPNQAIFLGGIVTEVEMKVFLGASSQDIDNDSSIWIERYVCRVQVEERLPKHPVELEVTEVICMAEICLLLC